MVDARASQNSFTAGEIDPELWGRSDLARYQVGVKTMYNYTVKAHGGASNRAGLRFVAEVKDSTKHVRLNKFEAAADEAFLLEVGDLYIRPFFVGAHVESSPGVPFEIVTTYTQTQIDELSLEQSNDVATLTHPDHVIRELSRTGALTWPLTDVTFQPVIATPTGPAAVGTNAYTGYGADVLPQQYSYKVAAISSDGEESLPTAAVTNATPVALGFDPNFVTITWAAVAGATEYVVYKAENGVYGLIGSTPNLTFKDNNIEPDFTSGPQQGANPFGTAGNYPSLATFAQGRRFFAATDNNPQTIWGSQSGNFKNMGTSVPVRADDALEFTLAARKKQDIFHMIPLEKGLIVFTRSGEWRVTGRDGDVIQPDSVLPEPQTYYGSHPAMRPIIVGQELMFCSRTARQVRNMEFSLAVEKYVSTDLCLLAKHLFKTREIVAWDYEGEPNGIIWCVMSDGELLSLTYLREHEVWGWGTHHTAGRFLDVRVIPEFSRDVPYFLIERRIGGVQKKYIEFLESRDFVDIKDAFFVDSGLTLDVPVAITAVTTGTSTTLTSAAHGLANGDAVDLDTIGLINSLGVAEFPLSRRYYAASVAANTFEIIDENGDDIDTSEYTDSYYDGGGVFREPVTSVSGAGHLEGRAVACLADGLVVEDMVVTGGVVNFGFPASRVHVGLAYVSVLLTLDVVNTQADDTGIVKGRPTVYARLDRSRGFKIGRSVEEALEDYTRAYENMYDPATLISDLVEMQLWEDWNEKIQVCVVQDRPLPVTVLGLTQDIEYGG